MKRSKRCRENLFPIVVVNFFFLFQLGNKLCFLPHSLSLTISLSVSAKFFSILLTNEKKPNENMWANLWLVMAKEWSWSTSLLKTHFSSTTLVTGRLLLVLSSFVSDDRRNERGYRKPSQAGWKREDNVWSLFHSIRRRFIASLSFSYIFGEINETGEFFFFFLCLNDKTARKKEKRDEKPTIAINMCVFVKEQINIYD